MDKNGNPQNGKGGATRCSRCRVELQNGVCPNCGFRAYQPMDEHKIRKIRTVTGVVCLVVFLILFLILQLK